MAQALRQEIAGMYRSLGPDNITVLAPEEGAKNLRGVCEEAVRRVQDPIKESPFLCSPWPAPHTPLLL